MLFIVLSSACIWLIILLLPWQPWRNQEILELDTNGTEDELSDVTVVIPARNEAGLIKETLEGLAKQGSDFG